MRAFAKLVGNGFFFLLHPKHCMAERFVSIPPSYAFVRNSQNHFKVFMPLPKTSWNIWPVELSVHLESVFSARDCVDIIQPLGQNEIIKSNNRTQKTWEINLFFLLVCLVFWGLVILVKKPGLKQAGEMSGSPIRFGKREDEKGLKDS